MSTEPQKPNWMVETKSSASDMVVQWMAIIYIPQELKSRAASTDDAERDEARREIIEKVRAAMTGTSDNAYDYGLSSSDYNPDEPLDYDDLVFWPASTVTPM